MIKIRISLKETKTLTETQQFSIETLEQLPIGTILESQQKRLDDHFLVAFKRYPNGNWDLMGESAEELLQYWKERRSYPRGIDENKIAKGVLFAGGNTWRIVRSGWGE